MTHLRVPEGLWATTMLPEGVLERWCVPDGAHVAQGQAVAQVRVEGALHDLLSPAAGELSFGRRAGDLVDPGMEIGVVRPE